ncbi:ImmA/IrrE family metallo-endopeptidase [Candidatus Saccharibacteria bacterium]|nr:ImmA/IrrE family metallo-endopeptidase [Candidatus Saccharibacteria bacterium]
MEALIISSFPSLKFKEGRPRYSPKSRTIYYRSSDSPLLLLHEIAHAELEHKNFYLDIERLAMERDAWEYVRRILAPRFNLDFDEALAETDLDSYRDWLHARSRCPKCDQNRYQDQVTATYHCPFCAQA